MSNNWPVPTPGDFTRCIETNTSLQWTWATHWDLPNPMIIASNLDAMEYSVFIIELDEEGKFVKTNKLGDIQGMRARTDALLEARNRGWPIKVEHMETYNLGVYRVCHEIAQYVNAPINAHLFIGFAGKGSFGWHADDGHVFCHMISGKKLMEREDQSSTLEEDDWLLMPKGLQHCATNITDTVMMSFGTYEFWGEQPNVLVE